MRDKILDKLIYWLGFLAGKLLSIKNRDKIKIFARFIAHLGMERVDPEKLTPALRKICVWSWIDPKTKARVSAYQSSDMAGIVFTIESSTCGCNARLSIKWEKVTYNALENMVMDGLRDVSLTHPSSHPAHTYYVPDVPHTVQ